MHSIRGAALTTVLLIVTGVAVVGFLTWFFYCPCERTSGGYLLGDEQRLNAPREDAAQGRDQRARPKFQLCERPVDRLA